MSLVAAYASDSDDDEPQARMPSSASNASNTSGAGSASRMGLPPPKTSGAKRPRVIRVDATLPEPEEKTPVPKAKPMLADPAAPHSLLSMLPAPSAQPKEKKQKLDTTENTVADDMRLTIKTDSASARDNEGFRAMLGLKPSARSHTAASNTKSDEFIPTKSERLAEAQKAAAESPAPADAAAANKHSVSSAVPAFSAAPEVRSRSPTPEAESREQLDADADAEAAQYDGWHQDPDGTWVPVTPEAHEIYARWLAENAPPPLEEQDIGTQRQFGRSQATATLDADAEMHAHWDSRPAQPPPAGADKPNMLAQVSERLQSDRLTNVRARTRGQLTSLIVQAQEKRQMLEERWSHGRQKMRENKKRYGF
ncbi:hypothetical protein MCUN1_000443 [Malassezia cuniculi]|uniref:Mitotic checkpoint regulator, MAD2B-interacting-domain-containing protein n=1 Tax=Malassezia cuniculi TaxID=948313 RepID=A0AAF0J527_9BASI|nr:hypothetical protein MCUN1_000443 [Malassezia cuniculi]